MKKFIKSFSLKFAIFTVSLVLSVTLCEFFLNHLLNKYQMAYTFEARGSATNSRLSNEEARRHDNIYEIYKTSNKNFEVVTIGDSFTNGGNVSWQETYPFQLFVDLEKEIPVSNMGICEDTTKGTYLRLKDYFENKKNVSRKTIVVAMIGVADMFYDSGEEFEEFYKNFIGGRHISSETMAFKIEDRLSGIEKLKTYKMIQFMYKWAEEKIIKTSEATEKENILLTKFHKCFSENGEARKTCFSDSYSGIASVLKDGYNKKYFRLLLDAIISANSTGKTANNEQIVEDLLTAIYSFPKMLAIPDVIYNLASYTTLQSKYSLKDDILPIMKSTLIDHRDFFEDIEKGEDQINKISSLVKSVEGWIKTTDNANKIQNNYYEKIIELTHKHSGEVIFLTYPLDYKDINNKILGLKNNKGVHVVDVYKVFSDLQNKGMSEDDLIGDWEHCTPHGYDVIAQAVSEKILEIAQK